MKPLYSLSSDTLVGTLVALLSILVALAGYQNAMSGSEQSKYNVQGQQMLTDANAEYVTVNQEIVYDFTMFDSWYLTEDEEKKAYYKSSFSENLKAALAKTPEEPFNQDYYASKFTESNLMANESDNLFALAEQFNQRGDALQLVALIGSLGLAFAAWASLLKELTLMRLTYTLLSIAALIYSFFLYFKVPVVSV